MFVLGAGKAGASMTKAIEEMLGERVTEGIITFTYGHLET
ncbi:MAG: hypothetical protein KJ804_06330 [Proteobacteria bacterium]|nr:hypothetical protein [Pseudomonadota bacterium]MBU1057921.1 hypothetical protein [Pseudomonadota bacterium]